MMFSTLVYVFRAAQLLSARRNQGHKPEWQALQMSMEFLLPSVFFSGFIFPRETMPWIFTRCGAPLPDYIFHRPHARDHSPRAHQFFRILAEPCQSLILGGENLRSCLFSSVLSRLLAGFGKEDR
jgi:hypothetical protein